MVNVDDSSIEVDSRFKSVDLVWLEGRQPLAIDAVRHHQMNSCSVAVSALGAALLRSCIWLTFLQRSICYYLLYQIPGLWLFWLLDRTKKIFGKTSSSNSVKWSWRNLLLFCTPSAPISELLTTKVACSRQSSNCRSVSNPSVKTDHTHRRPLYPAGGALQGYLANPASRPDPVFSSYSETGTAGGGVVGKVRVSS